MSFVVPKPIWWLCKDSHQTSPRTKVLLRALEALHTGDISVDEIMRGEGTRFRRTSKRALIASSETKKSKDE